MSGRTQRTSVVASAEHRFREVTGAGITDAWESCDYAYDEEKKEVDMDLALAYYDYLRYPTAAEFIIAEFNMTFSQYIIRLVIPGRFDALERSSK